MSGPGGERGGWTPPRPERERSAWSEAGAFDGLPLSDPRDPEPWSPPLAHPQRRPPWYRRLRPAARLGVGLAALAAAVVVVLAVGGSMTPPYGSLTPYADTTVADLRVAPTPIGWTTNVARDMFPGVPSRCVEVTASDTTDSRVLLSGRLAGLGAVSTCTNQTAGQVRSRVGLIDTATGRLLWTRDLSKDFSGDITVTITSVLPSSGEAVMMVTADDRNLIVSLDLATGRHLAKRDLSSASSGVQASSRPAGSLMLFGSSASREGSTVWTLVDARDVTKAVWSAVIPDSTQPVMTDDAVFTVIKGRSVRIDGETGKVTRFGNGLVTFDTTLTVGRRLLISQLLDAGSVITAFDDSGRRLWTRSGEGSFVGVSRTCVMAVLDGTSDVTCLDLDTGRARWKTAVGTNVFGFGVDGQRTDDVYLTQARGEGSVVTVLDGSTGRQRFQIALPALSQPVNASRTAVYVEQYTASGSVTSITAYDTITGKTLWSKLARLDGDTEIWGGHIVRVRTDGIVDELTNRPTPVLQG